MSSDYRSTFEHMVHMALGKDWSYEPEQMQYTIPRKYTPDFCRGKIVVECKGFFREGDTQKYRAIKAACDAEGRTLVMVLMNPGKKVRKGAHLTMAQWCEKYGIPWFDLETIDDLKEVEDVDD